MKFCAFTDIHFGRKGDDRNHNELCIEFVVWAIREAQDANCDLIVFGGDWHDSRNRIGVDTLNHSKEAIDLLDNCGIETVFILGNHDIQLRDSREINSISPLVEGTSIRLIKDRYAYRDGLGLVPWITDEDDIEDIAKSVSNCEIIFGHFEFPGFLMNERVEMPYKEGAVTADIFGNRYIFSGHFHKRQMQKIKGAEVHYIGNCFPHDFSDAGDRDRGLMIFDGKPKFINWDGMPTYDRVKLSDLLDGNVPDLGERSTVRVVPDVDCSKEDREEVVEVLLEEFGAGHVSLEPIREATEEATIEVAGGQSIDKLVIDWIREGIHPDEVDATTMETLYLSS